jgi:hypothetical protein
MKTRILFLFAITALLTVTHSLQAQGTAFTYEGRLNDNGSPANGSYDLTFTLFPAGSGGAQAAAPVTNAATAVSNGLFTVTLDFGAGVFNGAGYWLELAVRTNGNGSFTTLAPRQPVTPAPYAIYSANAASALTAASANSVAAANIVGAVPLGHLPAAVMTNNENGVNLGGAFSGNGGGLTNLQTTNLAGTLADSQLSTNIARLSVPNTNTQATGGVVVSYGYIVHANITYGGSGYTALPSVTVSDVSGSNAVITASLSGGSVASLTVTETGANYSAAATLTIAPPPSSAFQTFTSANTFNGVTTFNNASNTFAGSFTGNVNGSFTGNASGLTNLNAANLTGTAANLSVGNITVNSNLYLPATTANTGIIYSGGSTLVHDYGAQNFFAGANAGNFIMSGYGNTAIGFDALQNNTTGYKNTANGAWALQNNTTGTNNTANGTQALPNNTTGNGNTATGQAALLLNTTGSFNTANGVAALLNNTTGSFNTANGNTALFNNTTGYDNTATGNAALYANTTGYLNTANGGSALFFNTTGSFNTANGKNALGNNTTGSQNTANGASALQDNTTGWNNTADGFYALYNNTAYDNTACGSGSLWHNTTGHENTANGMNALFNNTTGCSNIAFGYMAGSNLTTGSYNIDIGNMGLATDTNIIRIGSGQTQTFIAGISGANASGGAAVYVTSSGQLGTVNIAGTDNTATGQGALLNNTTGSYNTANGQGALADNTSGYSNTANGGLALYNNTTGIDNTANGVNALYNNTNGIGNTANGWDALYLNTTGWRNTANGGSALYNNTTGSYNTANGSMALNYNTTGSNNIAEGYLAGFNLTTGSSNIDIGNMGLGTDANIIRIGTGQTQAFIAGVIIGDGSGLTNLNLGQMPGAVLTNNENGVTLTGTFSGNATGLTNLNPTNLSAGTAAINISGNAATATIAASVTGSIADAQLSANVALLNATNSFTGTNNFAGVTIAPNAHNLFNGTFTGGGGGLTNLPASAITGGLTVNLAVLVPGGGTNTLCFTNGVLMAIQ